MGKRGTRSSKERKSSTNIAFIANYLDLTRLIVNLSKSSAPLKLELINAEAFEKKANFTGKCSLGTQKNACI